MNPAYGTTQGNVFFRKSDKEFIAVETLLCSTKITQNGKHQMIDNKIPLTFKNVHQALKAACLHKDFSLDEVKWSHFHVVVTLQLSALHVKYWANCSVNCTVGHSFG